MAAITSADITYSQVAAYPIGLGRVRRTWKLTFPTGATNNQCPATGVPLSLAKLGCPRGYLSLTVQGYPASTDDDATVAQPWFVWNGSQSAPTLMAFNTPADGGTNPVTQTVLGSPGAAWDQNKQIVYITVDAA